MAAPFAPRFADIPDSRVAEQLRRSDPGHRFPPDLELEYAKSELEGGQGLIRTICTWAAVLAVGHAVEQTIDGRGGGALFSQLGVIVVCSVALALLAASPRFERVYRPWASVLVPVRDAVAAFHFAAAAAQGEVVLLMALPVMVICAFFFLGLRFRVALASGLLCATSFALAAAHYRLPLALGARGCLFLAATIAVAAFGARQLERRSRTSFLESELLAEMAQRDALTGARNRRSFDEHLARAWREAAVQGRPLAIVLIDVDHFKAYNDRYGHLAGDETLRRVAREVQTHVRRPLDLLARYGGEEFGVILYDVLGSEARDIADRMRRAVMDLAVEHLASPTAEVVTISLGIAAVEPSVLRECRGALQLADEALYQAKLQGRNGVELLDDSQYQLLVTGVFPNWPSPREEPAGPRRARHAAA